MTMSDKIQHHLDDDILLAYSAGALPEAFSLMVAAHVSLCDQCRATLESFDAVGGSVLDCDVGAVSVSEDCLAATLAKIGGAAPEPRPEPCSVRGGRLKAHVLPSPIRGYVGGDLDAVRWRPVGMGVKQAILSTEKGPASARLLFIPAGAAVPDHGHHGLEMTMVLKGAFSDGDERFARGDVEIAGEDDNHMPVADISEDCICLAVTDARLKFNSWLPKLAQPFLRI